MPKLTKHQKIAIRAVVFVADLFAKIVRDNRIEQRFRALEHRVAELETRVDIEALERNYRSKP